MDNEIVQQDIFMAPVVTVDHALRAYQAKKELIDRIMKAEVDYGTIPGSTKPTLLKAGAEKATSFFGLNPHFVDAEVVNDWTGEQHGGEPFFYYRRTCNLYRGNILVASVDGSCNSWEKKYRYRDGVRICPKCNKPTIIKGKEEYGGGWLCFAKKGGCGAKFPNDAPEIVKQEIGQVKNPDIADLVNTILKMADKRALVAATLIATGLSEYFTQDIDDFITGEIKPVETGVDATDEKATDYAWDRWLALLNRAEKVNINYCDHDVPRDQWTMTSLHNSYGALLEIVKDAEAQAKADKPD